jgi:hypothetical protein
MCLFVVYTSWQQQRGDVARAALIVRLEQQNRDLLCHAENSRIFELAITDVILAERQNLPPDPLGNALIGRLDDVRQKLGQTTAMCVSELPDRPVVTTPNTGR